MIKLDVFLRFPSGRLEEKMTDGSGFCVAMFLLAELLSFLVSAVLAVENPRKLEYFRIKTAQINCWK